MCIERKDVLIDALEELAARMNALENMAGDVHDDGRAKEI